MKFPSCFNSRKTTDAEDARRTPPSDTAGTPPSFTRAVIPPTIAGTRASRTDTHEIADKGDGTSATTTDAVVEAPGKSRRSVTARRARKAQFDLGPIDLVPQTRTSPRAATAALRENISTVKDQMNAIPRQRLVPVDVDHGYQDVCGTQGATGVTIGARRLVGGPFGEWIQIKDPSRVRDEREPDTYAGDKIHVSLNRAQLAKAFPIVMGHLCAPGSPFQTMKMTNEGFHLRGGESMASRAEAQRVMEGAQVTLYIHPAEDGFTATHLSRLADAVSQLESALHAAGVEPGRRPESDLGLGAYASYRHEDSSRDGNADDLAANRDQPVYRCLAERRAPDQA